MWLAHNTLRCTMLKNTHRIPFDCSRYMSHSRCCRWCNNMCGNRCNSCRPMFVWFYNMNLRYYVSRLLSNSRYPHYHRPFWGIRYMPLHHLCRNTLRPHMRCMRRYRPCLYTFPPHMPYTSYRLNISQMYIRNHSLTQIASQWSSYSHAMTYMHCASATPHQNNTQHQHPYTLGHWHYNNHRYSL